MTARAGAPTRTILVYLNGGKKVRVGNIPSNAKVTYGPVAPGTRDYGGGGNALRIYTSQNNQLAVFVGVASFRDESLTVQTQKESRVASEESETGPKGAKSKRESEVTFEWENEE